MLEVLVVTTLRPLWSLPENDPEGYDDVPPRPWSGVCVEFPVTGHFSLPCVSAVAESCVIRIFQVIYRFALPVNLCGVIQSSIEYSTPATRSLYL